MPEHAGEACGPQPIDESVGPVVRAILAVIPGGCTWLLPVADEAGRVADFRVGAASGEGRDIYGRGAGRVGALLSDLYPSMVDGPLWRLYCDVLTGGEAGHMPDFRYAERQAGVVADSLFDVSVHRVLGGLLVWWQRLDEAQRRLDSTELLGRLGWAEYDLATGRSDWSPGMYRLFDRDRALGPLSQAEQAAALVPDDRGLSETAWQTLDSGAASDVTVRFRVGGSDKHLRVLSEVARDADGHPLKIYALLQDVTARESSRTEIEQLRDQLRTREMTALAEHRLAAQLQHMIQPLPLAALRFADLEVVVNYLPAERAMQVGGDWYHAETLPDGSVVLAIGDVAGHGLAAASGMAHLRYSLIAWLSIGLRDPGVLVGHLNRLCRQLMITATAVVAFYDPVSRALRWSRGGHMPPLLGRAGVAEALDRPRGMLLGAAVDAEYDVMVSQLEPDDVLLFYTDGLVERRGVALLDTVTRAVASVSAERSLQGLPGRLPSASPDDDTCVVAVRVVAD